MQALSSLALLLSGGVLLSAFVALPVPLSAERVNRFVHDRYPMYDIGFADPRVKWRPGDQTVDLSLRNVMLRDAANDVVASIPELVLAIDPRSFLSGRPSVRTVILSSPDFRLERTAGGAVKIDIGKTQDGSSGSLIMAILTDLVAAPGHPENGREPIRINMHDARIHLADETSGARFTIMAPSATLDSVDQQVRLEANLNARTSGELLEIDFEGLFRSEDRSIVLNSDFRNVNPAILADLLPNLSLLAPIEIPLSGSIAALLRNDLSLRSARLVIDGQSGSLEVAQYTGRNIAVSLLRSVLTVNRDAGLLRLDDLLIDMQGQLLTGGIQSIEVADGMRILTAELTLRNASWNEIMPVWFGGLDRLQDSGPFTTPGKGVQQHLSFLTRIHEPDNALDGRGNLQIQTAVSGRPDASPVQAQAPVASFRIGGTPVSPMLAFSSP